MAPVGDDPAEHNATTQSLEEYERWLKGYEDWLRKLDGAHPEMLLTSFAVVFSLRAPHNCSSKYRCLRRTRDSHPHPARIDNRLTQLA